MTDLGRKETRNSEGAQRKLGSSGKEQEEQAVAPTAFVTQGHDTMQPENNNYTEPQGEVAVERRDSDEEQETKAGKEHVPVANATDVDMKKNEDKVTAEMYLDQQIDMLKRKWCALGGDGSRIIGTMVEGSAPEIASMHGEDAEAFEMVLQLRKEVEEGNELSSLKFQSIMEVIALSLKGLFGSDRRLIPEQYFNIMYGGFVKQLMMRVDDPCGTGTKLVLMPDLTFEIEGEDKFMDLLQEESEINYDEYVKNDSVESRQQFDGGMSNRDGEELNKPQVPEVQPSIEPVSPSEYLVTLLKETSHGERIGDGVLDNETVPESPIRDGELPDTIGPSCPPMFGQTEESVNLLQHGLFGMENMICKSREGDRFQRPDIISPLIQNKHTDPGTQPLSMIPDSQGGDTPRSNQTARPTSVPTDSQQVSDGQVKQAMAAIEALCSDIVVPSQEQGQVHPTNPPPALIQSQGGTSERAYDTLDGLKIQRQISKITRREAIATRRREIVRSVMAPPGVTRPDLGSPVAVSTKTRRKNVKMDSSLQRNQGPMSVENIDAMPLSGLHDTADCVENVLVDTARVIEPVPERRSKRLRDKETRKDIEPTPKKRSMRRKATKSKNVEMNLEEIPASACTEIEVRTKPHLMIATVLPDSQAPASSMEIQEWNGPNKKSRQRSMSKPVKDSEDQTLAEYVKNRKVETRKRENKLAGLQIGCSKCRYRGCSKCRNAAKTNKSSPRSSKKDKLAAKKLERETEIPKKKVSHAPDSTTIKNAFKGLKFLITLNDKEQKKQIKERLKEKIESMGGKILERIPQSGPQNGSRNSGRKSSRIKSKKICREVKAVITNEKDCRTIKSLYARVTGTAIVAPEWIDLCEFEGKVCDLNDSSPHVLIGEHVDCAKQYLDGISVYVAPTHPAGEALEDLLKHAGATILSDLKSDPTVKKCDMILLGSSSHDPRQVKGETSSMQRMARRLNIPCYTMASLADAFIKGEFVTSMKTRVQSSNPDSAQDSPTLKSSRSSRRRPGSKSNHTTHEKIPQMETWEHQDDTYSMQFHHMEGDMPTPTWTLSAPCEAPAGLPSSSVRTYFNSMQMNGACVKVGDCVELAPDFGEETSKIAKVIGLWTQHGLAGGDKAFGRFQRYYRVQETSLAILFPDDIYRNIICSSKHIEDNVPLTTVMHKTIVETLSGPPSPPDIVLPQADDDKYLCVAFYDHEVGSIAVLPSHATI